jgi:choline dehydrogenase-like flavoprotein
VNHVGESWDVRNLFVADASTFPTPSGVNPMITVQAIAYHVARYIKTRL